MAIKVVVETTYQIRLEDDRGPILYVSIDPDFGVKGLSGRLLVERANGERTELDGIQFLQAVWNEGTRKRP